MTKVQATFQVAIDAIGKDKVGALLERFGCYEEPTAQVCMEVLDREGAAFGKPFGELMKKATPNAKKIFRDAAKLSKAAGKGGDSMTAEQKSQQGLAWFSAIGDLLGKGVENVDDIVNATNGTNATLAQAQLLEAQRRQEEASQKSTLYWLLGGVGVLVVVMIFVIALSKRS